MNGIKKALAVALAGATALLVTVGTASPGNADTRTPTGARGKTVLNFNAQALRPLYSDPSCGAFLLVGVTGDGTGWTPDGKKLHIELPITGVVQNDNNDGFRIVHGNSGFEFVNSCYDLRLTNFYIQNFGQANQQTILDLSAKALEDGVPTGRTDSFELDLTNAQITDTPRGAVHVRSANLLLDDEGVAQFNNLAVGSPTGPYFSGEQVGKARTSVRLLY